MSKPYIPPPRHDELLRFVADYVARAYRCKVTVTLEDGGVMTFSADHLEKPRPHFNANEGFGPI